MTLSSAIPISLQDMLQHVQALNADVLSLNLEEKKENTANIFKNKPQIIDIKNHSDPLSNKHDLSSKIAWSPFKRLKIDADISTNIFNNEIETISYQLKASIPLTHQETATQQHLKTLNKQIRVLDYTSNSEKIILSTLKSYRACVVSHLKHQVQTLTVQLLREQSQIAQSQLTHGVISEYEHKKVLNNIQKEALKDWEAEYTLNSQMNQLKETMGIPYHQPIELDETIHFHQPEHMIIPLENYLPWQQANLDHEKNFLESVPDRNTPELMLEGSIDHTGKYSIGLNFVLTPQTASDQHHRKVYPLTKQQQQIKAQQAKHLHTAQLDKQYFQTLLLNEKLKLSAEELQLAQSNLQAAHTQFKYGQISNSELVRATIELRDQYNSTLELQAEYANAIDDFYQTSGRFHEIINYITATR